jgi:hypothetical protein
MYQMNALKHFMKFIYSKKLFHSFISPFHYLKKNIFFFLLEISNIN